MEEQERNVSFFRFEDLRVYAKATDYSTWLIKNLGVPQNEAQKTLVDSFCRSAYDIALNIAEGSARNKAQFEHYLKISKTAVRECVVFTEVTHNVGMMGEEAFEASREFLMELTRMLGALIISLQKGSRRRDGEGDDASYDNMGGSESDDRLDQIDTDF